MTQTLLSVFPTPRDLAAVSPEELGEVILEVAPAILQNDCFRIEHLLPRLKPGDGPSAAQLVAGEVSALVPARDLGAQLPLARYRSSANGAFTFPR
jgi:hypothetical protein